MIKTPDRYWKAHVAGVYTVYVFWHSFILPIYPVLTMYRDWIIIIKKKNQEWSKGIDKNILKGQITVVILKWGLKISVRLNVEITVVKNLLLLFHHKRLSAKNIAV